MNFASVFTVLCTNIFETAALEPQKPEINSRYLEPCARAPVWRACKSQLDHFGGLTDFFKIIMNSACILTYLGTNFAESASLELQNLKSLFGAQDSKILANLPFIMGPKWVLTFCPYI